MEIKRFFVEANNIHNNTVEIMGEELYHMSKVLRCKVGYKIIVCDNSGKDYYCTITDISKDIAVAKIDEIKENDSELNHNITLFQALPKGDKLDLITQKIVELGLKQLIPFTSRYTNETKFNKHRLEKISLEACKQCGRATICDVGDLIDINDLYKELSSYDLVIFPYENAEKGSISLIENIEDNQTIAIVIGSEGGFDESEAKNIVESGGVSVSLGKRILRCETAAIVASALTVNALGGLSK